MGEPETVESIVEMFAQIPDPRIDRTKKYSLEEVLFLVLSAVMSGVNHLTKIQDFGEVKLDWLRTILPYKNGVPSHDTICRILGSLEPDILEQLFIRWMERAATLEGVVAIDGKTLRGAIRRGEKDSFIHMVSAFSAENGLVYAQVKTDEKSNEITAIPPLLELLSLNGAIVTIDAAGCQTAITEKLMERGGDYLIAVKGNQKTLHEDLQLAFHDSDIRNGDDFVSVYETEELSFGRGEWRKCEVLREPGALSHQEKWSHVRTLVRVTSERRLKKDSKPRPFERYYICSIPDLDAKKALEMTRAHWSIENRLHWQLDVSFREDECRVSAANAAENLVVVRHIALNLLRAVEGLPKGIATRQNHAAWDDSSREKIICAGLK